MIKASQEIDLLYELASKIKPIKCKECGFEGMPLNDGRCPKCSSICGNKITSDGPIREDQLYSRSEAVSNLLNAFADSNDFYSSVASY